jgi:hypothetical protein
MIGWALAAQAATQPPASLRLPTGIELTGPRAGAQLVCVAEKGELDGKPEPLTDEQKKIVVEFSTDLAARAQYRDFWYGQSMPADWRQTEYSLDLWLTAESPPKSAAVRLATLWRDSGQIDFVSTVQTRFSGGSRSDMELVRRGSCELLLGTDQDAKQ